MTLSPRALAILLLAAAAPATRAVEADVAGVEFFEKKVRPILVERCFECHSEGKKVKGGLHLDSRDGWAKGGDTGPAIEPGKPEESLLVTAVRWKDRDLEMPPKKKLPANEIAVLEEWVKLGAPDPRSGGVAAAKKKQVGLTVEEGRKFWSYIPPVKAAPPAVKNAAWPRNDIDRFILAKLEEKGLAPAPDAAPAALLRRIYYNLTGLPPTPEQVDEFVRAFDGKDRESRLAATVDALLASPHFGETWGRHWLDVARFAESSGGGRTLLFKDAWRYRDYVIEAFDSDRPFDRFVREQIAGDLLPAANGEARRQQLSGTSFLALGPTNYEEQDKQQLRFDVIDEQLDTIGKSFLGQTIGCARCHDHKFDPIPQRDYYAMAGILASTRTLLSYKDNVARWIVAPLPLDGAAEEEMVAREASIAAVENDLAEAKKRLAKFKRANSALASTRGKPLAADDLPGVVVDDADAKVIGEWKESQFSKTFVGVGYRHDLNGEKGLKTLTFSPKLPASGRYDVRLAYAALDNRATRVPIHIFHANGEETVYVDETQEPPIDGRFVSLGVFRFEKDGAGYVLVSNDGTNGFVVADAVQFLPEEEAEKMPDDMLVKDGKPTEAGLVQARVKELEGQLKKLNGAGPRRAVAMTVREDDTIGDTEIRVRGVVHQRGAVVPRGLLQVAMQDAPPAFTAEASGRLAMADWLASPRNPLTARVFVNRVWHWLFGAGLVRTTDNFGTTGEAPSHPELLDFLAVRFVEEGWSVKKLVREIVLSRTWREGVQAAGAADPDNRLLAHANRRRLDAEEIRDTILAVSGELQLDVGGPNIAGASDINANDTSAQNIEYKYEFTDTRRSVYTPAFRNKRLELFEVFDFGDINATQGARSASNVAPQSLYLLNNAFVIEQSRKAAARALASSAVDDERLATAFRTSLGRAANEREQTVCLKLLASSGTDDEARLEAWSEIYQSLFGSIDFRYLE